MLKRLFLLCAIALMGSVLTLAQDQPRGAAAGDANTTRADQTSDRNDHSNWGWLGLLGLAGLGGLARRDRDNRTYNETRRDETIRRAA
jgi:MYXO-CTERM domain-containing protein